MKGNGAFGMELNGKVFVTADNGQAAKVPAVKGRKGMEPHEPCQLRRIIIRREFQKNELYLEKWIKIDMRQFFIIILLLTGIAGREDVNLPMAIEAGRDALTAFNLSVDEIQ